MLRGKELVQKLGKQDVKKATVFFLRRFTVKKLEKKCSSDHWSAKKSVGFAVSALLEEKTDIRDKSQKNSSNINQ